MQSRFLDEYVTLLLWSLIPFDNAVNKREQKYKFLSSKNPQYFKQFAKIIVLVISRNYKKKTKIIYTTQNQSRTKP